MAYDLIIIGAGPAGSTLAYLMAKEGYSVLILEQGTFPREKACAGGLTARITRLFDFPLDEVIEEKVTKIVFGLGNGVSVHSCQDFPIVLMTKREVLDNLLLERARQAGAVIRCGQAVEHLIVDLNGVKAQIGADVYQGKVIVGADGVNSFTARSLGLNNPEPVGFGLVCQISDSVDISAYRGAMHLDFGVVTSGYGWVFPKADHLSVGIYSSLSPQKNFKSQLNKYLKWKFPEVTEKLKITGHLIPLGRGQGKMTTERCLLLGDAAGLADPFTGEGIYYAVMSAHLAKATLVDFLNGRTSLVRYEQAVRTEIISELKKARIIAAAQYFAPSFNLKYFLSKKEISDKYAEVMAGRITYRELYRHLMLYGPKYLLPPFIYNMFFTN